MGFVIQTKDVFLNSHITKAKMLTKNSPITEAPGLLFWIEPVLNESFSQEEKGSGNTISKWVDSVPQSTSRVVLTQSDENKMPLYDEKAMNNLPALKFSGSEFLEADISANPISAPPLTIIAVVQSDNNSAEQILSSKTGGSGFQFGKAGNNKLFFKDHNGGSNFHFNYVFDGRPQILSFIYTQNNGTNMATLYSNGAFIGSDSHGHSSDTSTTLMLGTKQGTAQFWNGYIAEIAIFDRLLRTKERKEIERYLSIKYNIDLKN